MLIVYSLPRDTRYFFWPTSFIENAEADAQFVFGCIRRIHERSVHSRQVRFEVNLGLVDAEGLGGIVDLLGAVAHIAHRRQTPAGNAKDALVIRQAHLHVVIAAQRVPLA